jgi:uncharacterized protein (TIGR02996 family)
MSDEQAFLDAIKASPADPGVRLVYADWLRAASSFASRCGWLACPRRLRSTGQ